MESRFPQGIWRTIQTLGGRLVYTRSEVYRQSREQRRSIAEDFDSKITHSDSRPTCAHLENLSMISLKVERPGRKCELDRAALLDSLIRWFSYDHYI